jgi:protein-disulfide isomerase-like protein with CxxC motif
MERSAHHAFYSRTFPGQAEGGSMTTTRNDVQRGFTLARRIIRNHYQLNRRVTDAEVRAEFANIKQRHTAGTLDDNYTRLAARLGLL